MTVAIHQNDMVSPITPQDHRRAAAERSIEAILDAAERLLATGSDTNTSAVASAAGVSRVTLYSHFPTRPALLEAVAQRVLAQGAEAIAAARPASGEPAEALDRLIEAAWGKLDRNLQLFAAARAELSDDALRRAHEQIDAPILGVIRRGRRAGQFRKDAPATWLLATYYALMHAAADEVTAGRLSSRAAVPILKQTIGAAFQAD
jgi:AcrR family transcriptional regulator